MRLPGSPDRWIKRAASLVGAGAAVALVFSSPVPATSGGAGLDVRVRANLTGRLGVAPLGTFLSGDGLLPAKGHATARGMTLLTNQTVKPLAFQVRGSPSIDGLDDAVRVHVELDRRPVADTTLGRFRRWVGWNLVIPPGHAAALLVRVRLDDDAPRAAYSGQMLDVELGFRASVTA